MRFFESEAEAREVIATIIRPFYPNAHLFVAERNATDTCLRDVLFVARVKKEDAKTELLLNALFKACCVEVDRLAWKSTKIDFLNDEETEYIAILAVVHTGFLQH